jgi:transposase
MAKILTLRHERVDDIPLIIGLTNRLQLAVILDRHLGTHGLQEGLNNGQLAVGWLAYILSQADHRKSAVREWANGLSHTLGQLLGQPIRDKGLTRLLTLRLRLMTLLETEVRRGLDYTREPVAVLYEGQPTRRTDRPTGKRILQAFARAQITLTHAQVGAVTFWHLTPLAPLHEQLLRRLQLPASLYTALAYNSS